MAAFEQSLGNMTIRLQSLTMTAEQKASIRSIWEIFISVSSVVAHAPFVVVGGGGRVTYAICLSSLICGDRVKCYK